MSKPRRYKTLADFSSSETKPTILTPQIALAATPVAKASRAKPAPEPQPTLPVHTNWNALGLEDLDC